MEGFIKGFGLFYLVFGVLLYLPENKNIRRALRFSLSVILLSIVLQNIFS